MPMNTNNSQSLGEPSEGVSGAIRPTVSSSRKIAVSKKSKMTLSDSTIRLLTID